MTAPAREPREGSAPIVGVAVALLVASIVGVAVTQPRLAATTKSVKQREDVYVLPPPAQLRATETGTLFSIATR